MKEQGWDVGRMHEKMGEEERVTSVITKLKTLGIIIFFPVNGEVLKYQSKEFDVVSEGSFACMIQPLYVYRK